MASKSTNAGKGKQTKTKTKSKQTTAKNRKNATPANTDNSKSTGVVLMLIGLILALWFIVNCFGNIAALETFGSKVLLILGVVANTAIALAFVYYGFVMFVQKQHSISGWRLLGGILFFLSIAGMLHVPLFAESYKAAFSGAIVGSAGGVFGFIFGLLVTLIPSIKVQYVVLAACLLLGLMLFTDMKIFSWIAAAFHTDPEVRAARRAQHAEKKAARLAAQAEQAEAAKAAEAQTNHHAPDVVKDSKDDTFLQPPIITDYSGRFFEENKDVEGITVGDMMSESDDPDPIPPPIQEIMPRVTGKATIPVASLQDLEAYADLAVGDPYDEAPLPSEPLPGELSDLSSAEGIGSAGAFDSPEEQPTAPVVKPAPVVRQVPYKLPPLSLLNGKSKISSSAMDRQILADSKSLENVLASFGVKTKVVEVVCGPAIIRYELQPAPGVKVSRIVNLQDDIALALAAKGLRIEAPVPGKSVVGIEVAKSEAAAVSFKEVVASESFKNSKSKLSIAFGIDINGKPIIGDLASMPHLLIAGATGSGKSVCMNTLICSILYKAKPDEVKIIMIDPKKVELAGFNTIPHLARPVVTDSKKAALALKEVVNEMDRRYAVFMSSGVKNFTAFNELPDIEKMPQIVVLIDELADLMMVASREVEDHIVRLTQLARAAGIHLVVATQRPSVQVVTGLIKANIPSRIAFAVSSQMDSRVILDMNGAEKLLGKGDMLYHPSGLPHPVRVQGAFVSEEEIKKLVDYCSTQATQEFIDFPAGEDAENEEDTENAPEFEDDLFVEACQIIISSGQASASYLQRRFRIGYNRAARLVETMEEMGIISPPDGKKRTVLITESEFEERFLHGGQNNSI